MKSKEKFELVLKVLFHSTKIEEERQQVKDEVKKLKSLTLTQEREFKAFKKGSDDLINKLFDEKDEQQYIIHDNHENQRVDLFNINLDKAEPCMFNTSPVEESTGRIETLHSHRIDFKLEDTREVEFCACKAIAKKLYDEGWIHYRPVAPADYTGRRIMIASLSFYKDEKRH